MMKNRIMTALNMERSRYDIKHFYEWLGYNWGDHIGEWLKLYSERGERQVHRVCVIAPRDHSKSTTLRVKVLHQLLFEKWRGKPFTIWLFSANKDLAINRLDEIRQDLKRHPELSRLIDVTKGNRYELRLTNGAWIKATSVGSGIRGEHPAAIALDDVLDDQNDMSYDIVQQWFRKKLTPMLSPGTSIYCVGTPMSMNDLYHTEMLSNDSWQSWRKGSIVNYDEWRNDPDNVKPVCLWPSERPIEFLLEQRQAIGDLAFAQEYLCKVVDDDSAVFPQQLTRKNMNMDSILQNKKIHDGRYVIGFDPSHGIGKDYTVMVVLRQDKEGFIHIVNMWRKNDFPPNKQIDMIAKFNDAYKQPTFAFESAGFQSLYKSLVEQRKLTLDMKMSKVSNKTLKQGLLNRLRVWFEQEKVVIPYGNDETRRVMSILLDELESHAWKNGDIIDKGKHNDTVMAFAHAIDQFKTGFNAGLAMTTGQTDISKWNTAKINKNKRVSSKYVPFF
tara:strand:+ start:2125 stop:3624 length:1500 start_codon:yes stop_codon:yes gene_type:complete